MNSLSSISLFTVVAFKAVVFIHFFVGILFSLEEHWPRISLRLTRLLAEACSPFVKHVFHCGPQLSLRVFFLGRLPVGACCHAEPRDLKHCNLAVFASLNAKQHGVDQCWLQCSLAPWWKGQHTTTSQLTKQECRAREKDWGRALVWIKISFHLNCLIFPYYCKNGGNLVKRGHTIKGFMYRHKEEWNDLRLNNNLMNSTWHMPCPCFFLNM